jgi:hypothetical protein
MSAVHSWEVSIGGKYGAVTYRPVVICYILSLCVSTATSAWRNIDVAFAGNA